MKPRTSVLCLLPLCIYLIGCAKPVGRTICRPYNFGVPERTIEEVRNHPKEIAKILEDDHKKECWPNAVTFLGRSKGDSSAQFLIDFLEMQAGTIDDNESRAKRNVPLALGHLYKTGNNTAGMYLLKLIGFADSSDRQFKWDSQFFLSEEDRNLYFARRAVQGLGLSKTSAARLWLIKYEYNPRLKDVVADALQKVESDTIPRYTP